MSTVKNIFALFAIALVMQAMNTANAMEKKPAKTKVERTQFSEFEECYSLPASPEGPDIACHNKKTGKFWGAQTKMQQTPGTRFVYPMRVEDANAEQSFSYLKKRYEEQQAADTSWYNKLFGSKQ
ncbi:MAG: hypothetical protein AB7F19_05260 [Candidatus Babeliales bacterium]